MEARVVVGALRGRVERVCTGVYLQLLQDNGVDFFPPLIRFEPRADLLLFLCGKRGINHLKVPAKCQKSHIADCWVFNN